MFSSLVSECASSGKHGCHRVYAKQKEYHISVLLAFTTNSTWLDYLLHNTHIWYMYISHEKYTYVYIQWYWGSTWDDALRSDYNVIHFVQNTYIKNVKFASKGKIWGVFNELQGLIWFTPSSCCTVYSVFVLNNVITELDWKTLASEMMSKISYDKSTTISSIVRRFASIFYYVYYVYLLCYYQIQRS